MWAVYKKEVEEKDVAVGDSFLLREEDFHHLVVVCRLKEKDEFLLLNGRNLRLTLEIQDVGKKKGVSVIKKKEVLLREDCFVDLLVGTPKKETQEIIIKSAVEMGVRSLFFCESDYSAKKMTLKDHRLESLIQSAMVQSNNPFAPHISYVKKEEIDFSSYDEVLFFSEKKKRESSLSEDKKIKKTLIVIGPEGGHSQEEISFYEEMNHAQYIHLPTPILKVETAVIAALGGYFFKKM